MLEVHVFYKKVVYKKARATEAKTSLGLQRYNTKKVPKYTFSIP